MKTKFVSEQYAARLICQIYIRVVKTHDLAH